MGKSVSPLPNKYDYLNDPVFNEDEIRFLDRWLESYLELDEGVRGPERNQEEDILAMLQGQKPSNTKGMEMYLKWRAARDRFQQRSDQNLTSRGLFKNSAYVPDFLDDRLASLDSTLLRLRSTTHGKKRSAPRWSAGSSYWLSAILATDAAKYLNSWLTQITETAPTVYDQAVDAIFNSTQVGGWKHRLFDESHSPLAMWEKVRDAVPNDSYLEELVAYFQTMSKDLVTPAGLPFTTISQDSYGDIADTLNNVLGIPSAWTYDVLTIDAVEILGSSLGIIALALHWDEPQREEFASLIGGIGVAGALSANPILTIVAVVSLARALHMQREQKNYAQFLRALSEGGIGTAIVVTAASTIGGPAWVGLIVGLIIAIIVRRNLGQIRLAEIAEWLVNIVSAEVKNPVSTGLPALARQGKQATA